MKPKVSIGVCVRNSEDLIKEAIESIIGQDYPHEIMEVIFVDDGSEDETLSVIESYVQKMDMSTKVFHQEWRGLGPARNVIVNNAEGKYIVWVDGDMIISRDFVTNLVKFMDRNPEVGIAKGTQLLESGGNLLSSLEAYSRAAGRMVDYQSEKASAKVLGTGGSIYRVEAIEQVGGFNQNLRGYGEDLDIELKIRAAGWSLHTVETNFSDYEKYQLTWKALLKKYWLRGYHAHYFLHKNIGLIKLYKMLPPAGFIAGLLDARMLFRLTNRKVVFLLPFQDFIKMSAWCIGFIRSHMDSYEPRLR